MGRRRIYADRLLEREPEPPAPESEPETEPAAEEEEPGVLGLQRTAGNAAVARLLQRDTAGAAPFSPVRPGSPLSMRGPTTVADLTSGLKDDFGLAHEAVRNWFDKEAAEVKAHGGGSFVQSVAELVYMAGALPFTTVDGKPGVVRDAVKPEHLEMALRERAKTLGVTLLEHRAMSDVGGVKAEAMAILANLGKIPTEAEFGGDAAKITVSIFGKISGEADLGKAKVEGEVSAEGAEGSVKFPGGKVGVGVSAEGISAEVSAGDLVKVKGKVGQEKDGGAFWKAEITIGTLGHVVTPAEVAKVMKGAQDTFGESAAALSKGLDPAKIKEHGGALKDAVTEVVEKAKKSASQKPGWTVGLEAKGTESGGFSASVTFTWVF